MKGNESLNQYFTPVWAAELIIQHYYPDLGAGDVVFDIGCGDGRFLMALPDHVKAYGFEIDPVMVAAARKNSGRPVIEGDFALAPFPEKPTLLIGNPPFEMAAVNRILDRAFDVLDFGREAGFLLPVYFFQTADTVVKYNEKWTLKHDLLPRNLFEGMQKPCMFARFIKEKNPSLFGMFLYGETQRILQLAKRFRTLFIGNRSSTHLWGEVIEKALIELGGSGTLQDIYRLVEGNRPTGNAHWKEQVRKVLQKHYRRIGPGTYALEQRACQEPQGQLALAI